jgi:hypothetical protein
MECPVAAPELDGEDGEYREYENEKEERIAESEDRREQTRH